MLVIQSLLLSSSLCCLPLRILDFDCQYFTFNYFPSPRFVLSDVLLSPRTIHTPLTITFYLNISQTEFCERFRCVVENRDWRTMKDSKRIPNWFFSLLFSFFLFWDRIRQVWMLVSLVFFWERIFFFYHLLQNYRNEPE